MNEVDPVLYVIMRNDLPSMNSGKAMAQAAHAANQMESEAKNLGCAETYLLYENWKKQVYNFGTTIVLSASSKDELESTIDIIFQNGHLTGLVIDPTYPYIVSQEISQLISMENDTAERLDKGNEMVLFRREITCGYVFGRYEHIKPLVDHLDLA